MAGASEYRVGWLAVADYQANIDNDRWRERFAYSDVNASSSYTVTRLTPGDSVLLHHGPERGRRHSVVGVGDAAAQQRRAALPQPAEPSRPAQRPPCGCPTAPTPRSRWLSPGTSSPERPVTASAGWPCPTYEANRDNDRWRERFAYSDISGGSSYYTVTRLTPGIAYYFILGRKQGDDISVVAVGSAGTELPTR